MEIDLKEIDPEVAKREWKVWTWDMMEPGLASSPYSKEITYESIANYAKSVLNENPIYVDDEAARADGEDGVVGAPTMCFTYAPVRRWELFNERGFLAPEQALEPRSTPFAGTEIAPQEDSVRPGDVITSVTSIARKWESRSGNKFVGFRVVGHNQNGQKVCDYEYNIIWEFTRGQKSRKS